MTARVWDRPWCGNLDRSNIGDTVDVHVRIVEGDKQRVQIFTGTVIARNGTSNREAFTVRRIVNLR